MATCKDCSHVEACKFISQRQEKFMNDFFSEQGREISVKFGLPDAEKCPYFKDRSRFVELPCNMGDTVYIALNGYGVLKDTVKEFRITSRRIWIRPEEFGMDCLLENMAFLTREEAEQALKARSEQP